VVRAFRPELILVSAGFDAHRDDPLAAMEVSASGYQTLAAWVRALADEACGGRVAYVLEGGYAATGLREGVAAVLAASLGRDPVPPPRAPAPGSVLSRVLERVVGIHGARFPGLGAA
jgi:acetoin utilization deacetylase AcuC-like enzyme